jgi:hypothetical protein
MKDGVVLLFIGEAVGLLIGFLIGLTVGYEKEKQ